MQAIQLDEVKTHTDQIVAAIAVYKDKAAAAKRIEAELRDAEIELITLVGHKDEGSFSVTVDDKFKVTTNQPVTRKLNAEKFAELRGELPEPLVNRLIRVKPATEEVNTRELKFIQNNEPDYYRYLAPAIEVKPGKLTVKVEAVE